MKHYLSFIVLLIIPCLSLAQDYRVITSIGKVEIDSFQNKRHKVKISELLSGKDVLYVENGGMITLNYVGTERCISIGPTAGMSIESIVDGLHFSFWKKIVSAIKGVDNDGRLNAAIKGEDPVSAFLYAFSHPVFSPSFKVRFDLIRNGNIVVGSELKDGERVNFRIHNEESVPLFVVLVWLDSMGEPLDCLAQVTPFLLVPPESTIDLTDDWLEIGPPYGVERILLFASEEAFDSSALLRGLHNIEEGANVGVNIGFYEKIVNTRL